ncbi:hypothetical protein [Paractinoplanes bogorensis]|uniref:hypothetical protein n=1 Tax=Paractinoplanes bogorensis TaxID=1610840 RepID=UPI001FEC25CB|nr:hypothetical protein [Actinoplanes bogorensis]
MVLSGRRVDMIVAAAVAGLSTWWWHQFRFGGLVFGLLAGRCCSSVAAGRCRCSRPWWC